jgi:hypothetical protein
MFPSKDQPMQSEELGKNIHKTLNVKMKID